MEGLHAFIDIIITLAWILVLARLVVSWMPFVPYSNPAVQALIVVVDPFLRPLRRVLGPTRGNDFAPIAGLALIFVVGVVVDALFETNKGYPVPYEFANVAYQLAWRVVLVCWLVMVFRIFITVIAGDRRDPALTTMNRLTNPVVGLGAVFFSNRLHAAIAALVFYTVLFLFLIRIVQPLVDKLYSQAL